jgi:Ca2+:H+ antiporter
MVEPDDPTLRDRVRSIVNVSKSKLPGADRHPTLPLNNVDTEVRQHGATPGSTTGGKGHEIPQEKPTVDNVASEKSTKKSPSTSASSPENGNGEESASIEPEKKQNVVVRFYNTSKQILFSSYVNLLLVFVPVGIALNYTGVSPTVVFSVNAIAIIPLAALLSYATESVAASLGDTIGALLNVTFGNAVELIILYVFPTDGPLGAEH